MTPAEEEALGKHICDANQYTQDVKVFAQANPNYLATLDVATQNAITSSTMNMKLDRTEKDYRVTQWEFKGNNYRVAWSMRIPYTFTDRFGNTVEEYILVGYEGSAGP